jgi:hypothetical protein
MFHMLTCFNLVSETAIDEFQQALANFTEHMTPDWPAPSA